MKHILSRGEDELLKKVYLAQEEKPNQGDFVKLIEHDLKMFELNVDDIRNMPKEVLKTLSQLNYTNVVQKWSFLKCGFSTCLASKIKGKHVYGNIIVLFLQKITRGAS